MSEYSNKLRDPRWQKMRLQVMDRDDWRCQICSASNLPLNVHHRYYVHGKEPWDYPLKALVTLCENCHEHETAERREAERQLLFTLRAAGFYSGNIQALAEAFSGVDETQSYEEATLLLSRLLYVLKDPLIQGMIEAWQSDYMAREMLGADSEEYQQLHEEHMAKLREWEETYQQRPQDDGPVYPRLRDYRLGLPMGKRARGG